MKTQILDAKGLLCPMPVIKVQDAMPTLPADTVLEVHCTDPGTKHDIPAWCRVHGHSIESIEDIEGVVVIRVKAAK